MRTFTRTETLTALILFTAGLSAFQVSSTLAPFVSADNTLAVVLQIQPSSSTINVGAFAKFGISLVDNSTSGVSLVARGVPPGSVAIFAPSGGIANPAFNSTLTIVTSPVTPTGTYVVAAVAIVNSGEFTANVTLQVLAVSSATSVVSPSTNSSFGSTLVMAVSTDKNLYQPNSTVSIRGQVTDGTGDAIAGANVSVQVDGPNGAQLLYTNNLGTDSAGAFESRVGLASTSLTGTYTVFATAAKSGYSSTTTRTTFVVVASTTPSVIIRAVYAGNSAGKPSSIFTVGQTIWVWVVIQNIGATFQGVVWIQIRDPNGVPVQIQIHIATLEAGQTTKDGIGFTLLQNATTGVYTVNALVSDKLISQGGIFLASSQTQFALVG